MVEMLLGAIIAIILAVFVLTIIMLVIENHELQKENTKLKQTLKYEQFRNKLESIKNEWRNK